MALALSVFGLYRYKVCQKYSLCNSCTIQTRHRCGEQEQGSELSRFISDTLDSINSGLKGKTYFIKGDIQFELSVVTNKKVGRGFKVIVADIGGKYEKEKLSKMKFSITPQREIISVSG